MHGWLVLSNALARCVLDPKAHRSSNALLHQLHWLPIRNRIDFKLATLAFLARSFSTSMYLNSSVARYLPSRTLRSQDTNLLAVPRKKTVRSTENISVFCRLLKKFYFRNAFNQHLRHHPRLRFNISCWHCSRKEIYSYLLTYYINATTSYLIEWLTCSLLRYAFANTKPDPTHPIWYNLTRCGCSFMSSPGHM